MFLVHLQWSMFLISLLIACFLVFNQGIQSGMIDHIASYIRPFHEWLAQAGLSTSRWVPCYRAIEQGWSSRAFHEGCQQDGPSVVLVRKKSFIFGGFSDISLKFEGRTLHGEISSFCKCKQIKRFINSKLMFLSLCLQCMNYSAQWRWGGMDIYHFSLMKSSPWIFFSGLTPSCVLLCRVHFFPAEHEKNQPTKLTCRKRLKWLKWDRKNFIFWIISEHFWGCDKGSALGMQSGAIPDSHITASSEHSDNAAAPRSRLYASKKGSLHAAWIVRINNQDQWLQVDIGEPLSVVTAVATQGRGSYDRWVTSYKLQYSDKNGTDFQFYTEQGSTDSKVTCANIYAEISTKNSTSRLLALRIDSLINAKS